MMKRVKFVSIALLIGILLSSGLAYAGVNEGISYLKARQNADGGFSEPGAGSSGTLTCWVLLAGFSSIKDPTGLYAAGQAAVKYNYSIANRLTALTDIELYTLTLSLAGADPRNVSGRNLISLIKANIGADGKIGKNPDEHCWGIMSLVSAGEKVSSKSTGWLVSKQRVDGGWGNSASDIVRQTALSVEALIAAGETDAGIIGRALKFLRDKMGADGGFAGSTKVSDGQLTATVVRAIYAAGDNPASSSWTFQGANPVSFLNSLQAPDGHYRFSSGTESDPAMTTATVLPALSKKHFPLGAKSANVSLKGNETQTQPSPNTNTTQPAPGTVTSQPTHDLGTVGSDIKVGKSKSLVKGTTGSTSGNSSSSGNPSPTNGGTVLSGGSWSSTGAFGNKTTWFGSLWMFLIVCATYVLILLSAYYISGIIVSPKRSNYPRANHFTDF
jgi:hypothetical protein